MNAVVAVARADLLERVRRRSFFLTTAVILWICFEAVPDPATGRSLLSFGSVRGLYNSAWFGLQFGLTTAMLIPLPGFYLTKGSVGLDRRTRVGQILATTRLSGWKYLLGKWLSNVALLLLILAIVSVGAVLMLQLRREAPGTDLVQLLVPTWSMGVPLMSIVAAIAVLFESIRPLRRGLGNVLYFFVWSFGLGTAVTVWVEGEGRMIPQNDPLGMTRAVHEAEGRVRAADPSYTGGFNLSFGPAPAGGMTVVEWPDSRLDNFRPLERASWLLLVVPLLGAAVVCFDRFDPDRERVRRERSSFWSRSLSAGKVRRRAGPALSSRWLVQIHAELQLLLRGRSVGWWLALLGLFVASLFVPLGAGSRFVLPALWVLPIFQWSALGARHREENATPLLATATGALPRIALAEWIAGALLALALALPLAGRFLLAGDTPRVLLLVASALFPPALATALGSLTGGRRAFEAIYIAVWYLAVQAVPPFDLFGIADQALSPVALRFAAVSLACVTAALWSARRQQRA